MKVGWFSLFLFAIIGVNYSSAGKHYVYHVYVYFIKISNPTLCRSSFISFITYFLDGIYDEVDNDFADIPNGKY